MSILLLICRRNKVFSLFTLLVLLCGCSAQSAKKNYVLAEKLWSDGKYAAAVSEFEKVAAKDPLGKLGTVSLFRAAMTQAYFLSQYGDALRKLKTFSEVTSDRAAKWEAQRQMGELLFSRLEQFDQVIPHYRMMITSRPNEAEVPEFLFRIGRSHFFLRQFKEAIEVYQDLAKRYPHTPLGERGAYEVGVCFYTQGGRERGDARYSGNGSFQEAIDSFENFIRLYPQSEWVVQARFDIASSLEELDQLETAYHAYEVLKTQYPSPKVIQIRMIRIKERLAQRSH